MAPLHIAVEKGFTELVKLLLNYKGINVNNKLILNLLLY